MRLLLDTHVVLWWLRDDHRLPGRSREQISAGRNEVFVSAISVAEMAIKSSLGKLTTPPGLLDTLDQAGFSPLAFTAEDAEALRALPWHHRDPFDRMLVAQAQTQVLTLVTMDQRMVDYGIPLLR